LRSIHTPILKKPSELCYHKSTRTTVYEYNKSVKSSISDEPINTYLLRPLAGLVVRVLYRTTITPNQLTIASTVAGLVAALAYLRGSLLAIACGGVLVSAKDILDSADGQLARAKQQYSRKGRFLDSIGDFVVNLAVFSAIGCVLVARSGDAAYGILAFLGLGGITFRVSYHVFYQTSFLHEAEKYETNRILEEVKDEDREGDRTTLYLQMVFQLIYGWQDRLILRIDRWCGGRDEPDDYRRKWFLDRAGIRLSSFLGMGTELFLLTLCSLLNRLELYLDLNLLLMNAVLLLNIIYRKAILSRKLA
jgi:phosphatidylglycerophosphate synthase